MTAKLDASLKGKFVNVNGEKVKIVKLDRAGASYVLEDGTHVPAAEITKRGRGLFYAPAKKRSAKASAKPAAKTRRVSDDADDEAAVEIDRELKGKFITLNPGTRNEDKQKIVAIVKNVGYKTEEGIVVPAGDVFKKGRGVFANVGKSKSAKAAPSAKTSGLKPKSEIKKASVPASGLKPKSQVKRRAERDDSGPRVMVKKFTQALAQRIEDCAEEIFGEALSNGTLSDLDVQLAAINVTFEDRGLLMEAAFVPGNAKEAEVTEFTEKLFGNDGGADEDLDEEEEELDDEEEEELDDEEEEELDDEEEEELDDEEEEELDDEEEEDEDLDEEEDEDLDEEEEDLDEEDEDFDDEEEEDEDFDDEEELEEEEDEVDFDTLAKSMSISVTNAEKYGQLYIDSDFDTQATIGSKVRDVRSATVYHFVGSNTSSDKDAKIVLAKKGGKLTTVSLDTFAKHFEEV